MSPTPNSQANSDVRVLSPVGSHEAPLRMLLVDSWYDTYKGVILLIRIFDGVLRPGDKIISFATKKQYIIGEVGIMHPLETATSSLRAGQVGYIYFNPGMKISKEAKMGDTFTHVGMENVVKPCLGFEDPKPMVFVGAFPVDQGEFNHLDDSISQLVLNDRSVTLNKEHSEALGQGWRLGFLGLLLPQKTGIVGSLLIGVKARCIARCSKTDYGRNMALRLSSPPQQCRLRSATTTAKKQ